MPQSFLGRLPLSRHAVDRDHLSRARVSLFDELWADPATRVLPIFQGTAILASEDSLALLPVSQIPDAELLVYLGRTLVPTAAEPAGSPIVAALLQDPGHLADAIWGSLRTVGAGLSDRDAGLLTEALAILNWHTSHEFSPRTGTRTVAGDGGWVRRDPDSGAEVFPRTDAAVIVGVTDADDRLLLGRNALWDSDRYSLLAGFVEPGESLEAAVEREVMEEAGLQVVNPVYLGSQPWPFPASLMLGFTASVDLTGGAQATPDGKEILDLRWFSRGELRTALSEIRLPGRTSIARAIIERWFGGPISDGQS